MSVVFLIFYLQNFVHRIPKPQLIVLLFVAFPVRSALEYGHLTILFCAIASSDKSHAVAACFCYQDRVSTIQFLKMGMFFVWSPPLFRGRIQIYCDYH